MRSLFVGIVAVAACSGGDSADDADGGDDDGTTGDTDPGGITLEEGFEDSLTRLDGCGDLLVYAVDEADMTMLTVQFQGPLAGASYTDMSDERDLPDPNAQVTVVRGERVSDLTCDDAIEGGGSVVIARWVGGEGHVVLAVDYDEANPEALPAADVTVTDIRLRPSSGTEDVTLDTFGWTDVAVGWLPGR